MQIKDLDEAITAGGGESFVLDNESGNTKKISFDNLCAAVVEKVATTSTNVTEAGMVADARAVKGLADAISGGVKTHFFVVNGGSSTTINMSEISGGSPGTWVIATGCTNSTVAPNIFACSAWCNAVTSLKGSDVITITKNKNDYTFTMTNSAAQNVYGFILYF